MARILEVLRDGVTVRKLFLTTLAVRTLTMVLASSDHI